MKPSLFFSRLPACSAPSTDTWCSTAASSAALRASVFVLPQISLVCFCTSHRPRLLVWVRLERFSLSLSRVPRS